MRLRKLPAPKKKGIEKKAVKAAPAAKAKTKVAAKAVGVATKGPKKKGAKKAAASSTKAASRAEKRCREPACDQAEMLVGYCRLHYVKNWRRIKKKEVIIATGQLSGYVEELVAKYPDKYLDAIENDLASERDWNKVVGDLELSGSDEESGTDDEEDRPSGSQAGRSRTNFDGNDSF